MVSGTTTTLAKLPVTPVALLNCTNVSSSGASHAAIDIDAVSTLSATVLSSPVRMMPPSTSTSTGTSSLGAPTLEHAARFFVVPPPPTSKLSVTPLTRMSPSILTALPGLTRLIVMSLAATSDAMVVGVPATGGGSSTRISVVAGDDWLSDAMSAAKSTVGVGGDTCATPLASATTRLALAKMSMRVVSVECGTTRKSTTRSIGISFNLLSSAITIRQSNAGSGTIAWPNGTCTAAK
mmetsp:Transcript_513/g.1152  ORF Transcript_513/g.1152 Transcript_513/m.1152 type:complete len:237 (+) Transcript_513:246-956(+)